MVHEKDSGSSHSLTKRPKFFKVLMQDPSLKLRIPRKFHRHLPSGLRKMATLLCPHAMSWDIQIHQSGPDIFFQGGWPEFIKAHDLCTGDFLVFQYNGNMDFDVDMFDITCCLKDYSRKHCTRVVPPGVEIEDSSESEIKTLHNESERETHGSAESNSKETNSSVCEVQRVANKQNNFRREQIEGTSCRRPMYIKIEDSSESEDTKNCKQSHEIPIDSVQKRRKLSNSNDKVKELFQKDPRVVQMEARRKKTPKPAHSPTSSSQFEKILTLSMIKKNMISIPKAFCVKNDLITSRTIFLKRKIEGEVIHNEWRVGFFFGPTESRIRNGWRKFSKENNLKIGERCIFQFISKDTFLVQTVPKNHTKIKGQLNHSNFKIHKEVPRRNFQSATSHSKRIVFATRPKDAVQKESKSDAKYHL